MLSIAVGYLASRVGAGIGQQLRIDLFEKVESFSNVELTDSPHPRLLQGLPTM